MRLLIIGSPGAGKTRLARQLAARIRLPLIHLDDAYWGEGWTRPCPREWEQRVMDLCKADDWIIDGNHLSTLSIRLRRAQHVLLVETPRLACVKRVLMRPVQIRRGDLDSLPIAVREQAQRGEKVAASKDLSKLVRLCWSYRQEVLPRMLATIADYPDTALSRVIGCHEAAAMLEGAVPNCLGAEEDKL